MVNISSRIRRVTQVLGRKEIFLQALTEPAIICVLLEVKNNNNNTQRLLLRRSKNARMSNSVHPRHNIKYNQNIKLLNFLFFFSSLLRVTRYQGWAVTS